MATSTPEPELDVNEVQEVPEYANEIHATLRALEPSFMPDAEYMTRHPDLTWWMRSLTVNWLVEVAWRWRMYPETLFLTVNVMDRYLSTAPAVPRTQLQLVATAALMVASKMEEITSPSVEQFVKITVDAYSAREVIDMEQRIVLALDFRLNAPPPLTFLRRISKANDYDIPTRTVAKYLQETTLLYENFLAFPPSTVAAACMLVARNLLDKGEWTAELQAAAGGPGVSDLGECANLLCARVRTNHSDLRAVYKKYSTSKFLRSSLYVEQELRKRPEDRPWV